MAACENVPARRRPAAACITAAECRLCETSPLIGPVWSVVYTVYNTLEIWTSK